MTDTAADALVAADTAHRAALALNDADLTAEANLRRRSEAVRSADASLEAAAEHLRASLASSTGQTPDEVLRARRPSTSDAIAVVRHEQDTVRALLGQDVPLARIVAEADERRLDALLDMIETLPGVVSSGDAATVAAELRADLFERLVALGAPDAVEAAEHARNVAPVEAWAAALSEAARGPVTIPVRQRIREVDPDGYGRTFGVFAGLPMIDRDLARLRATSQA